MNLLRQNDGFGLADIQRQPRQSFGCGGITDGVDAQKGGQRHRFGLQFAPHGSGDDQFTEQPFQQVHLPDGQEIGDARSVTDNDHS